VPSLAGHSAEDIAASLAAFRTGARPATVMNRIAKGFSEPESRAIADWIARGGP
jgi:cytochrome c553